MSAVTFPEFKAAALAQGYDEVIERTWQPLVELDSHTHPFAVAALVTQGEMWLTVGAHTRHLGPGDGFELDHDVPHAERYGSEGATYWVARRNAAAT